MPLIAPEIVKALDQDVITQPQNYFSSFVEPNTSSTGTSDNNPVPSRSGKVLGFQTAKTNNSNWAKIKVAAVIGSGVMLSGLIKLLHFKKYF